MIGIGNGVELRPVSLDDAPMLYAAIERNRARLRQWLPWVIDSYSVEDAKQFLTRQEKEHAERSSLTCAIWIEGEICGAIGLHRIDSLNRSTSIGYWLDAAREGAGIMTAACRAIVTEGFARYGLHRIEIRCATGNVRSGAIPRRLGFIEEGVLRDAQWLFERWVDLRVFSMLQPDWSKNADSVPAPRKGR